MDQDTKVETTNQREEQRPKARLEDLPAGAKGERVQGGQKVREAAG
ncbi:MAG TPA: hypothetical protein VGL09_06005 [Methylomirabilota bacterium]|jgi:hypothetical protein